MGARTAISRGKTNSSRPHDETGTPTTNRGGTNRAHPCTNARFAPPGNLRGHQPCFFRLKRTVRAPATEQAPPRPTVRAPATEQAPPRPTVRAPATEQAPPRPTVHAPTKKQAPPRPTVHAPTKKQAPPPPTVHAPTKKQAPPPHPQPSPTTRRPNVTDVLIVRADDPPCVGPRGHPGRLSWTQRTAMHITYCRSGRASG